ncbi:sulfite exporter TauE/SafE family protein [Caminicella sporogenes]|uniref:sulfite exporter TauE/SafE family protein n=1 Tax=Caminicella sporogenes TaxID=166485 RepID=UPI00253FA508|nr:sulfite exporter TauE/SafE family protein [Caminicella sporogenes]WIF94346.1 sulfite exporter TauE/SafE family protein [Caminicella sporogenes]
MLSIIGLISGIISGMGIGGGTILIPALILFTKFNQHQAQSVNLFTFIPIGLVAVIIHIKNKNVDLKLWFPLTITGILGAIIGSKLAINLSPNVLKKIFGIFLFIMAIYQFIYKEKKTH